MLKFSTTTPFSIHDSPSKILNAQPTVRIHVYGVQNYA